jgi:transposase
MSGRKTDVSDAAWLADLGAHGLVTASLVPPPAIRALRDLTRARTHITRERSREVMRLEKLLEDAGIKLFSVATDHRSIRTSNARSADRRPDRSYGDRRSG